MHSRTFSTEHSLTDSELCIPFKNIQRQSYKPSPEPCYTVGNSLPCTEASLLLLGDLLYGLLHTLALPLRGIIALALLLNWTLVAGYSLQLGLLYHVIYLFLGGIILLLVFILTLLLILSSTLLL